MPPVPPRDPEPYELFPRQLRPWQLIALLILLAVMAFVAGPSVITEFNAKVAEWRAVL